MAPSPEPRIAVFCRCGAQWFGRAVNSGAFNISCHRNRCGELVPAQTFELLGYEIAWPRHWTEPERDAVRSASLLLANGGKTPAKPPAADS